MNTAEPLFATCLLRLMMFNLDGMLVDSVPDLIVAVDNMLASLGRPPTGIEEVRQWIGNGVHVLVCRTPAGNIEHDGIGEEETEAVPALFMEAYADSYALAEVYPGVVDILKQLKCNGVEMALIISKPECFVAPLLGEVKLGHYLRWVIGGDTLPQQKSDPAALLFAMKMVGTEPEDTLFVGDPRNDVLAAKAAGVRCAALIYGYDHGRPVAEEASTLVIDNLRDLPPCADQAVEIVLPDDSLPPSDQQNQVAAVNKLRMKVIKVLACWRWRVWHHPPPDSRRMFTPC